MTTSTIYMFAPVFVVLLLLSAGCKRKSRTGEELPVVITNRTQDVAYIERLKQDGFQMMAQARERDLVSVALTQCLERVKAGLPEGADDAAVRKALEQDKEWRELGARQSKVGESLEQLQAGSKARIRARMEAEMQAAKAVREGRARVAELPNGEQ